MLYDRIIKQGTINEPDGKPDPQFALPSTVNWMRALRLLAEDEGIDFVSANAFYGRHGKRSMEVRVENTVLEQLFLGRRDGRRLRSGRSTRLVLWHRQRSERDDNRPVRFVPRGPRGDGAAMG